MTVALDVRVNRLPGDTMTVGILENKIIDPFRVVFCKFFMIHVPF